MGWQTCKKRFLSLEVSAWIGGENAEGMCAEEVMCGFAVKLLGDAEEREKLCSIQMGEDRRIEVDYSRSGRKDHVVDLVAQL